MNGISIDEKQLEIWNLEKRQKEVLEYSRKSPDPEERASYIAESEDLSKKIVRKIMEYYGGNQ